MDIEKDLRPGMDLNPFYFPGGPVGCLLIHGANGSPLAMRGMGEYLAAKGLTVRRVRLAGHGTTPEDLATKTWRDFVASAEEGLRQIQAECPTVFVAGLSMGGVITLYLAARYSFDGAIAMSAPTTMHDWRLRLAPVMKLFVKFVQTEDVEDLVDQSAAPLSIAYRRVPVAFAGQFVQLQRQALASLAKIKMPVLIMQGEHDRTIPPESASYIYTHISSPDKELVTFPNSGHVITIDADHDAVWAKAFEFILQHVKESI